MTDPFDRLEALFQAALELPPAERDAFLDEHLEDEPELREELRTLLEHAAGDPGFLDRMAEHVVAPASGQVLSEARIRRLDEDLEGRYRIAREIGRGGMASVYLAQDLRHHRQVALKVLDPRLAAVLGPERFLAEIRTTANLQHPHILPLFDSGEAAGSLFYVMPYVKGESLRARLDRETQLPVDEAVRIASEVADALDHAHRQGVVHRDVKPGNILLRDGKALVTDFGIALAAHQAGGERLTETGLSLGTPYYMSPEQATGGRDIGPASDVYALGCVVYEMLVGEPPYSGRTAQAVLARVLTGDVTPVSEARPSVPPHVEAVVTRALEKLPADRFRTAGAMKGALDDPTVRWGAPDEHGARALSGLWNPLSVALAVLTLVLAGLLVWSPAGPRSAGDPPLRHYQRNLPAGVRPIAEGGGSVAITEDGSRIVYEARTDDGGRELRTQLLSARNSDVPIAGTENADGFFLSPDGNSVAFHDAVDRQLKAVPIDGGSPVTIARAGLDETQEFVGGAWGRDGTVVYGTSGSGLWRAPVAGGEPEELTSAGEEAGVYHHHPRFLPDGTGVVFSRADDPAAIDRNFRVAVLRFGGEVVELVEGHSPLVTEQGFLVYSPTYGELWAAALNGDASDLAGDPVRVMTEGPVRLSLMYPDAPYAISRSGTLIYAPEGSYGERELDLVWVDREGQGERILRQRDLPNAIGAMHGPRLSPDGTRVAFRSNLSDSGRNFGLFVWDLERSAVRVIPGEANADWPVWWGDDRLVFNRFDEDGHNLYWTPADGRGTPQSLWDEDKTQRHAQQFTSAGLLLYQERVTPAHPDSDIWLRAVEGNEEPRVIVDDDGAAVQAAIDPTERWLAYSSDFSGTRRVYVTSFPEAGGLSRVTLDGGWSPVWSPVGDELFFRRGADGREMWVARVSTDGTFRVEGRELLFEGLYQDCCVRGGWGRTFDVSPDGQRFLMIGSERRVSEVPRIEVIQGWLQDVRRQLDGR